MFFRNQGLKVDKTKKLFLWRHHFGTLFEQFLSFNIVRVLTNVLPVDCIDSTSINIFTMSVIWKSFSLISQCNFSIDFKIIYVYLINTVEPLLMATSPQCMVTSLYRPGFRPPASPYIYLFLKPPHNGHLYTTATKCSPKLAIVERFNCSCKFLWYVTLYILSVVKRIWKMCFRIYHIFICFLVRTSLKIIYLWVEYPH